MPTHAARDGARPGTPAAAAGLQPGDRIVSIGGQPTVRLGGGAHRDPDQSRRDGARRGRAASGQQVTLTATIGSKEDGTGFLGVAARQSSTASLGSSAPSASRGRRTGEMVTLIFEGIGMMFTGKAPVTGLAGPGRAGGDHPAVERGRPGRLLPDPAGLHQHQPGHPQHAARCCRSTAATCSSASSRGSRAGASRCASSSGSRWWGWHSSCSCALVATSNDIGRLFMAARARPGGDGACSASAR